jgi:hypothetical protein
MKTLIASALMLLAPALALAQSSTTQPAPKAASKPAAKAQPAKQNTAKSTVASGIAAAEAALTPEELAIAERVHTGRIACELGAFVQVDADLQSPGRFHVEGKGFKYHMAPVATSTGTVRLEDQRAGAVWIQIANKSMLMNQKLGQRMADECMSPAQVTVAEAIKKNPPPSLLDAPAPR